MRKYTVDIDGTVYTGSTASAKNQLEALHIVGRTGFIAVLKEGTTDMGSVTFLLQIPFTDVKKLIDLVVKDLITTSDKVPVAENLFEDDIQNYYLLLSCALKENLINFWKLRRQSTEEEKAAELPQ